MRNYEVWLMKGNVAHMYHGMEKKLFQVFQENKSSRGILKVVTDYQIAYITKPIPADKLNRYIYDKLFYEADYSYSGEVHFVRSRRRRTGAIMWVSEDRIFLEAEGELDVEARFFEVLRGYDPYFMAVNHHTEEHGWLRPLRIPNMMQR